MKPVTARNEVAPDLERFLAGTESNLWLLRIHVMNAHVGDLKHQRPACRSTRRNQVLHHFVLSVDSDTAARQSAKVDVPALSVDIDEHTVMEHALAPQSVADTAVDEQIDGTLFQHSRTHALDDVIPGAIFHNDRVDPRHVQQVSQHQARGTCSHNAYLSTYCLHLSVVPINSCVIFKPLSDYRKKDYAIVAMKARIRSNNGLFDKTDLARGLSYNRSP